MQGHVFTQSDIRRKIRVSQDDNKWSLEHTVQSIQNGKMYYETDYNHYMTSNIFWNGKNYLIIQNVAGDTNNQYSMNGDVIYLQIQ